MSPANLWARLTGPQRATLLLLAAVVASTALFLALFERIDEEREIGLSGEARVNDYLALERFLIEMGIPADSVWGLEALPAQGWVVLLDGDPDFRQAIERDVLDWVAQGGVAVVGQNVLGPHPILEGAGFTVIEPWQVTESESTDTGLAEQSPTEDELEEAADIPPLPIRSLAYGAGHIVMLPEPSRLTNDRIHEPGHIDALWQSAAPLPVSGSAVLVIRGQHPSLLGAIWRAGWPAVLSLIALILAGCWRASRRLGPMLPDPTTDRRSLVEHIEATGVFLWRNQQSGVLLQSARRAAGQPPTDEPITDPRQFTAEIERLQQEWKLDH